MKILEVVFDLGSGGAERLVLDLSNEMSKSNDVSLLAIKDDSINPEQSLFYKPELSDRVQYKNLKLGKGYSLSMAWAVYKAIKSEEADVVHIHGVGMPYYCIFALFLLNRRCKFFQTIHNDIHNGYKTVLYKFLFRTLGYSHKMGFIAISNTNYKDMMLAYPKTNGVCISNGRAPIVPTGKFEETGIELASYKNTPDSIIYLHVARCNPQKNQMMLVEAFSKFVNAGHDADLIIIGGGFDSQLGETLKSNAGPRIHFIGTRKNIGDYMLNADIFCLSSKFEGMPITLIEASLAGVPIVSTPVCGAVDVIENNINGILSSSLSLEDYLIALEYSFSHLQELKRGARNMQHDNPYTIAICAKKYLDLFADNI